MKENEMDGIYEYSTHEYCIRNSVWFPEVERPHGGPSSRWEDNIKMDLLEIGCEGGVRIELADDREQMRAHVSTIMNLA
jgi:hypothetical protein